ncbi:hypothetical protein PISMIDRAFT_15728 [Pisolithus microcarpus 441]|uniref:Unplaced genomic scaffold scaffold_168, whole genome shotgun sequence n=1 Tax=Pisolithus microcarpus 441 TaxID=765257 RepID=A0A0C9YIW1_9AGAM|nr:hypothetical protein PISMIDRAFT_15728 [Pisolithus microcarpus 441]
MPEDVTQFVQKNPAAKGFMQKLKLHLLPRIHNLHTQGHASDTSPSLSDPQVWEPSGLDPLENTDQSILNLLSYVILKGN